MKSPTQLRVGWYVPGGERKTRKPRWVLAIGESTVLYSDGRSQRECSLKAFRYWVRKHKAQLGIAPEFEGLAA